MIIVLEFHERKEVIPVILSLVNEETEKLLQFLVDSFRLSISLRMIHSGGSQLYSEKSVKFLHKLHYELGTSVRATAELNLIRF